MGFRGADWLDRPERESEENVEGALNAIGLKPGMTVAEVGAGTGYVALRMATASAPPARCTPTICSRKCCDLLRDNAAKAGNSPTWSTVLGSETDPKLPPAKST